MKAQCHCQAFWSWWYIYCRCARHSRCCYIKTSPYTRSTKLYRKNYGSSSLESVLCKIQDVHGDSLLKNRICSSTTEICDKLTLRVVLCVFSCRRARVHCRRIARYERRFIALYCTRGWQCIRARVNCPCTALYARAHSFSLHLHMAVYATCCILQAHSTVCAQVHCFTKRPYMVLYMRSCTLPAYNSVCARALLFAPTVHFMCTMKCRKTWCVRPVVYPPLLHPLRTYNAL